MARINSYATALVAAFAAFALAGGIHASETAATAVEREHGATLKYHWVSPIRHAVHDWRKYTEG
jgi:hypothetical protein